MSSLGKDWSGSRIAPKPKKALGLRLGDREEDSKCFTNSTLMLPFSRLSSGPSRSVSKLCWRETCVNLLCQSGHYGKGKGIRVPSQIKGGAKLQGTIGELSRANSVKLLWVPGHSRVVGNEKADRLANRGTKSRSLQHRPTGGLPGRALREASRKNGIKKMAGGKGHEGG